MHVDQLHWQALSAYGNPHVKTPAMDRIAADGVSFRASYAANPLCCPARGCWYTGRMSSENGQANNKDPMQPDVPDLGSWLRQHGGYETVYSGKWHIGRPVSDSFNQIYGQLESKGEIFDPAAARAGMGFLDNYQGDKPFFLNVGFVNPHDCCYTNGAAGGEGKFAFDEEVPEEDLPPIPENFYIYRGNKSSKNPAKERFYRYYMYVYYRWVEMVDAEVGRVYDALMHSRFADNTVVIFSSDHGEGLAFHGLVNKNKMVESSWRVPTTVVTPERHRRGQADNEHLSISIDLPATICDYAGVPPLPKMTFGKSLRPLVEDKPVDWHEYIVGENWNSSGEIGLRDATHKTIFYDEYGGQVCVYNLETDPLEMNDLFGTPEGKAVLAKHKKHLREYVDKLEVYEPDSDSKMRPSYKLYLDWYRKVKEAV